MQEYQPSALRVFVPIPHETSYNNTGTSNVDSAIVKVLPIGNNYSSAGSFCRDVVQRSKENTFAYVLDARLKTQDKLWPVPKTGSIWDMETQSSDYHCSSSCQRMTRFAKDTPLVVQFDDKLQFDPRVHIQFCKDLTVNESRFSAPPSIHGDWYSKPCEWTFNINACTMGRDEFEKCGSFFDIINNHLLHSQDSICNTNVFLSKSQYISGKQRQLLDSFGEHMQDLGSSKHILTVLPRHKRKETDFRGKSLYSVKSIE